MKFSLAPHLSTLALVLALPGLTQAEPASTLEATQQAEHAAATEAAAEKSPSYVRAVEEDGIVKLETGIARLTDLEGHQVDLIGAVHIGDQSYYEALNELFSNYEAVLFELVLDGNLSVEGQLQAMAHGERLEGQPESRESIAFRLLRISQDMVGNLLDLSFQTEHINYLAENFIHADMTKQQFTSAQQEANESLFSALSAASATSNMSQEEQQQLGKDVLVATAGLLRGDALPAKRFLARTLAQQTAVVLDDPKAEETVLLEGRNTVALGVLDQQLAEGLDHVALFYGAAHLPDLIEQLQARGYELDSVDWLPAWTIAPDAATADEEAGEETDEQGQPAEIDESQARPVLV